MENIWQKLGREYAVIDWDDSFEGQLTENESCKRLGLFEPGDQNGLEAPFELAFMFLQQQLPCLLIINGGDTCEVFAVSSDHTLVCD